MTVLEVNQQARTASRWTEVCAAEHLVNGPRVHSSTRPAASGTARRAAVAHSTVASGEFERSIRPVGNSSKTRVVRPSTSVGAGRRMPDRPASTMGVRACRVDAPPVAGVVDDVPTWALLACGLVLGIIMLLAVVLIGGPTYM